MLDVGIGERGINTFLSSLNIPAVGSTSLKRWEREVGKTILLLANDVCKKNIDLEKKMTMDRSES